MNKNYLKIKEKINSMSSDLPYLARVIGYIVFRYGKDSGVDYKTLAERLNRFDGDVNRFDEGAIKSSLEDLASQKPPLIVVDTKKHVYKPSENLERFFRSLNLI